MATTAAIRAAAAAALQAGFPAWNVSAYLLSKPEPPSMDITWGPITYDTAMARGNDELSMIVRAVVQWSDAVSGQEALDPLLDTGTTTSLKAVMEADRTLGGVVSSLRVLDASEVKIFPVSGASDMLGVEFTVAVTPNG